MQKSRLVIALSAALVTASCASTQSTVAQSTTTHKAPTPATLKADPLASAEGVAELTLEQIMADPDWMGRFPENAFWSLDGQDIL
ncbi:MAG: S9 family peptidase, partial [Pseudomonadota bacterium]|nr:S9 family peptidase [Pseudomonadota bacterium]